MNLAALLARVDRITAAVHRRRAAHEAFATRAPVARILELRAEGHALRAIVATLTAEGHTTKHGARWHLTTVARVVAREAA